VIKWEKELQVKVEKTKQPLIKLVGVAVDILIIEVGEFVPIVALVEWKNGETRVGKLDITHLTAKKVSIDNR